jgi:hypothetical protein
MLGKLTKKIAAKDACCPFFGCLPPVWTLLLRFGASGCRDSSIIAIAKGPNQINLVWLALWVAMTAILWRLSQCR